MSTKLKKTTDKLDDCGNKKVRCKSLIIDGGKYRTTLTKKYEKRKNWVKPNDKCVHTFIPGTIKDIFISEGDRVKQGDHMLILEAMKMYNTIEVPHDGVVKKIHVNSEDKLPKGALLVEFE